MKTYLENIHIVLFCCVCVLGTEMHIFSICIVCNVYTFMCEFFMEQSDHLNLLKNIQYCVVVTTNNIANA